MCLLLFPYHFFVSRGATSTAFLLNNLYCCAFFLFLKILFASLLFVSWVGGGGGRPFHVGCFSTIILATFLFLVACCTLFAVLKGRTAVYLAPLLSRNRWSADVFRHTGNLKYTAVYFRHR